MCCVRLGRTDHSVSLATQTSPSVCGQPSLSMLSWTPRWLQQRMPRCLCPEPTHNESSHAWSPPPCARPSDERPPSRPRPRPRESRCPRSLLLSGRTDRPAGDAPNALSLIHISEFSRLLSISY